MLGPFLKATGQQKYLFMDVNYFTKWEEAEVVASIFVAWVRMYLINIERLLVRY